MLVLMLLTACDDAEPSDGREGLSGTCGLPTPEPGREESLVPKLFLPSGSEVSNAQAERGGFIAAINVPLGVTPAFDYYREAVEGGGYEIIQTDNEGFEAELYLRKGKHLAAVQIRTSTCNDRSIVFVNQIVPEKP